MFQTSATASKKIENRAEKLHTYATFSSHLCQKLVYCKKSRARKMSRVVPRERKMVLSVLYILRRKFPISYVSLCVNFAFILNTVHCDAYRRDGVV